MDKIPGDIKRIILGYSVSFFDVETCMFLLENDIVDKKIISEDRWKEISWCSKITENFIRKFEEEIDLHRVNWGLFISYPTNCSMDFICEFQDYIPFCEYLELSGLRKDVIWKYRDCFYWPLILEFQKISDNFAIKCLENLNQVNWKEIYSLHKSRTKIINRFQNEILEDLCDFYDKNF